MTETLVIQAVTGLLAAGVGSFSSYKLLEWRQGKLEARVDLIEKDKLDATLCIERRATCDPCRKRMDSVITTQDQVIHCVNKYVDDCRVGVK